MLKKFFILGVIALMIFTLAACNNNKYNATIYDNAYAWLNQDFLSNHLTYDTYTDATDTNKPNPNPASFIIKTQEEYESFFTSFPPGINLKKEMLLLYVFTTIYPTRTIKIKSIELSDEELEVNLKEKKPKLGVKDAAQPGLRCIVVKIEKVEATAVRFAQA